MAVNITEVRFLNVPLENDYKHTLYFATKSAQETYFASKVVKTMANCSYQRKDKIIRASFHIDTMYNCNYVMYKNSAYGDRWFYAFITDMEYVDDGRTDIHIETDVMQTWKFDVTIRPSFIEREHVTDDSVGLHTVPEQLETGEYVCNGSEVYSEFQNYGVVIASTLILNGDTLVEKDKINCKGGMYNNIFSGVRYYVFPYTKEDREEINGIDALEYVIETLANNGFSDCIVSMFIVPMDSIEVDSTIVETPANDRNVVMKSIKNTTTPLIKNWYINKPDKLVTYTPKNNKLYCYPYSYIMMSNHNGGNAIYQYELFNTMSSCTFRIHSAVAPGCSIRLFPTNYSNEAINYEEGLTCGKFPICSWNTDVYTNWLTQNAVNIGVSLASAGLQIAGGVASAIATGGVGIAVGVGTATSGVLSVANTVGEIYKHSLIPPQAEGNINSGDACFSGGNLTFKAYHKCIRPEFAKIIDGYFTMFGYKVNVVKTPNTNHRNNFWFTKTVDVNLDGAIPNKDLQRIKDVYNTGVTFWRYPANIGNYDVDNSII